MIRNAVRRHPRIAGTVAFLAVGLAVFVVLWFEPQKLFLDQRVDEAFPETPVDVVSPLPSASVSPNGPTVVAQGPFRSLEHGTTGRALLIELPDGSHVLRLQDLMTSNGPDLRVYLSEIPAGDDWHAYGERFVDLGALKGNVGSQNYRIPRNVDLSRYRSAVIWCRRFTVGFGVAPLRQT